MFLVGIPLRRLFVVGLVSIAPCTCLTRSQYPVVVEGMNKNTLPMYQNTKYTKSKIC